MSALAITEALDATWANWPSEASSADLQLAPVSGLPEPTGATTSSWQLTDRGIAVAVVSFLAVFLTGVVVLVGAFLAVPEQPLGAGEDTVAVALVQR